MNWQDNLHSKATGPKYGLTVQQQSAYISKIYQHKGCKQPFTIGRWLMKEIK